MRCAWLVLFVAVFLGVLTDFIAGEGQDDAVGTVYDAEGAIWSEYHDEATGRSYYHDAATGRTQWTISISNFKAKGDPAGDPVGEFPGDGGSARGEDDGTAAAGGDAAASEQIEGGGDQVLIDSVFGSQQGSQGGSADEAALSQRRDKRKRANTKGKGGAKLTSGGGSKGRKKRRQGDGRRRRDGSNQANTPPPSQQQYVGRGWGEGSGPHGGNGEYWAPSDPYGGGGYGTGPAVDGYGGGGYYTVHSLGSVHPQGGDKYVIGGAMMGDSSGGGGGSYALDYYAAYGMLGPLGVGPDGQVLGPADMHALGGLAYMDPSALEHAMGSGQVDMAGVAPPDADSLHLLQDPAGMVQLEAELVTPLDHLEGVKAMKGGVAADTHGHLKSPLVFHEMFLRLSPGASSGVEEVRASLEERVLEDDGDYESWEQLGHVWRHYGNVGRTVDCYRKALSLLQTAEKSDDPNAHAVRSSLHINLAGLLDQMNYISDALVVLQRMLDADDVLSYEAENNFAVGYMMVAQLELRGKRLASAEGALAAALQLQPRLRPAVLGVHRELKHWQKHSPADRLGETVGGADGGSGGGEGALDLGGGLSSATSNGKDPWLALRVALFALRVADWAEDNLLSGIEATLGMGRSEEQTDGLGVRRMRLGRVALGQRARRTVGRLSTAYPRGSAAVRKAVNALPCLVSGVASRAMAELGWFAQLDVGWSSSRLASLFTEAALTVTPHVVRKSASGNSGSSSFLTGSDRAGGPSSSSQGPPSGAEKQQAGVVWLVSIYLLGPLLLGHAYAMLTDFLVVDCLVLLFVGGLLFPVLASSSPDTVKALGPLRIRLVRKATP